MKMMMRMTTPMPTDISEEEQDHGCNQSDLEQARHCTLPLIRDGSIELEMARWN